MSDYRECVCFQRHRPIRKVNRSSAVIVGGLALNLLIIAAFYLGLIDHFATAGTVQKVGISFCIILFAISFASFLASIFITPGYMTAKFDFVELVDTFLENNIHLDNLCVFCQIIKGERSFHCTICNKCSDNYDHHCPFIDNCLGTRNHKYFLIFVFSYLIYSLLVVACTLKHVVVIC